MVEHLSGYQRRDREVVDYQMGVLAGTELHFRGPFPDFDSINGNFFTCVGAAQTFGCFAQSPFPTILSQRLNIPALNLGYGGAGPAFFVRHPELLDYVNRGRFAILQIMSGRSESNALFDAGGLEFLRRRKDGLRLSAREAYRQVLESTWPATDGSSLRQKICRRIGRLRGKIRAASLVRETRNAWVHSYERLFQAIHVPIVLLWFSTRAWRYPVSFRSVDALFGDFPQLINERCMKRVLPYAQMYVEVISSRGFPQELKSRFTGLPVTVTPQDDRSDFGNEIWTHNCYYPTPEMHVDAATALLPKCLEITDPG